MKGLQITMLVIVMLLGVLGLMDFRLGALGALMVFPICALTAPTNDVAFNDYDAIINLRCDVYYSLGTFDAGDIPATRAALVALYSGATPKFVPLGEYDDDPFNPGWERDVKEVNSGILRGRPKINGQLNSISLCPEMLTALDSAELDGEVSLLFVPKNLPASFSATTPGLFWALSGVKLVDSAQGSGKGDWSGKVTIQIKAKPNLITDVWKCAWLTS